MRRHVAVVMCLAALGFMTSSSHFAIAQQKTVKACQEEWRANKAANQANKVTEKAYVAECRGVGPVAPTAAPATPPAPAPAPTAAAPSVRPTQAATGQKTIKACQEEWRANRDANQASGVTEKAYVDQCRTGAAPIQPTAAPAPAPAPPPTAAAPPSRPAPSPTVARPAPTPPPAAGGANEFSTEAQAKARCPSDTVVWVTLNSKIYHFAGTRFYGTTKNGAYMCEGDTAAAGMRAAKNETHP